MRHRTLRLISVFLALLWIPSGVEATTGDAKLWWGGAGRPVKQPIRNIPTTNQVIPGVLGNASRVEAMPLAEGIGVVSAEIVSVVGSRLTYEGHIVNFETRYAFYPNTNTCSATVAVENPGTGSKAFLANVSPEPRYASYVNANDDKMIVAVEAYQFHLKMFCRQLQSAFLNNQKVSVTGIVESLGNAEQNTLGTLRIVRLSSTPETASFVDDLPSASLCLQGIDCTPEGTPARFLVEAEQIQGDGPFCQVDLKINTSGTDQKVRVYVPSHGYRLAPIEARRFMHALDCACEVLLEAMGSQKTVGVVGRGSGGSLTASRVSSPGPFIVEMESVF